MRRARSTIVLLAVLAGLGAYIYFVTWKKSDVDAGPKKERIFATFRADKLDEIRVRAASGDVTTIQKQGADWKLTDPIAAGVDDMQLNGVTGQLAMGEITRVIDENPTDLKDYGLATPRIEVDFKGPGDKDFQKLQIGEKTTGGVGLFARRNDEKRVFVIPAYMESSFNVSTFDLRDKSVLRFDHDKVDAVQVVADGKTLALAKESGEWKIKEPQQVKADSAPVEGLLSRLQSAQMKTIAAAEAKPGELKQYALDKPAVTVSVGSGSSRAVLLVGGKAADGNTYYARDASTPAVVTIDGNLVDDLKRGADNYRRKDLFEFRPYNASHIDITRDGQTTAFDLVKEKDDPLGKWKRVGPKAGDVDKDKFEDFLTKLSNMRAIAFPDSKTKTGLDRPVMTVALKYSDSKEERVSFGKVDRDIYATLSAEPGNSVQASEADFNQMTKALDEVAK
jgi:hypothetical protein